MLLAVLFCLGIANFALHKAVIESGHPAIETLPEVLRKNGGRLSLSFEFAVILAAMLLATHGWPGIAWLYSAYSLFNGVAAWLILGRRI